MRSVVSGMMFFAVFGLLHTAASEAAYKTILPFRDAVYLQVHSDEDLLQMYRDILFDLYGLDLDEREELYYRSLATYYLGRAYQDFDERDMAIKHNKETRQGKFRSAKRNYSEIDRIVSVFERSLSLSLSYLEGGRDARGVWLYTITLSQLTLLKSMNYLFVNGPKIGSYTDEAIALDGGDVKARILKASKPVYAPRFWGGNPDKGIKLLQEALKAGSPDREDLFNIFAGIGYAHAMAKRPSEALKWLSRAQDIYPTNVFIAAMIHQTLQGEFGPL